MRETTILGFQLRVITRHAGWAGRTKRCGSGPVGVTETAPPLLSCTGRGESVLLISWLGRKEESRGKCRGTDAVLMMMI